MNIFSGVVLRLVFLLWPFYRVRTHYADRVPKQGAVIIVPKHQRYLDIPVLTAVTKREIRYMAKEALFRFRLVAWYLRSTGTFPVEQNSADKSAIRTAAEKLAEGEALGIFAEGRRIKGNVVGEIEPGLLLAMKKSQTSCPIVPCGICYGRAGLVLTVDVYFGEPFLLVVENTTREEQLEEIRQRVQDAQNQAWYRS
jgi:1-acyl-sn-glycerol-3-phosphate acyltransferase